MDDKKILEHLDAEEFLDQLDDEKILEHYGTPRHSGRYPWGSGDNPYQRDAGFLNYVNSQRRAGRQNLDIARSMNMNSTEFRKKISQATTEMKRYESTEALRLKN